MAFIIIALLMEAVGAALKHWSFSDHENLKSHLL
jgi:hypothetical protein